MQDLRFPLTFTFNIGTLANDFTTTDATNREIAYVRQKMLRLKEDIQIYRDGSQSEVMYQIRADRWLDWSAAYAFYDAGGREFGKVARRGWKSIWKAEYEIVDDHAQPQFTIREENGWVKVIDQLVGELPVIGWFTGYVFNPSYLVTDRRGREVVRLSKQASFFGRRFQVDRLGPPLDGADDERIMLGLMMMILLERRRG
ncbi:hypothetical protein [Lewinella sp. IMCC34183]|uniref:hypothetical protein n=1 Tax=Lewinella sp. IMCC34183 TaxID=2248762 RepID=UPI000E21D6E7|nr:hypothetical protein [Lewinella sp. IMCC34183]